jgi:hypothetical protein
MGKNSKMYKATRKQKHGGGHIKPRKTINKIQAPTISKCHPGINKNTVVAEDTCVTPNIIDKIDPRPKDRREKLADLHRNFDCDKEIGENRDVCVLKAAPPTIRATLSHNMRPERPDEWKKNPNAWLSNEDILKVLHQYDETYPTFHFFEPTPIDFDYRLNNNSCVRNDLCKFSVSEQMRKGISDIGIVFNLDKHDESGSHWTSMFIDIPRRDIYYFDSANDLLPKEVETFVKRITDQTPEPRFSLHRNDRAFHQKSNTECGMYSLYFIINMLLSRGERRALFKNRFNNPKRIIKDKDVEKYRKFFFI